MVHVQTLKCRVWKVLDQLLTKLIEPDHGCVPRLSGCGVGPGCQQDEGGFLRKKLSRKAADILRSRQNTRKGYTSVVTDSPNVALALGVEAEATQQQPLPK